MGGNLQITYLLVKHMRVSNACNTNFRLFIVLGDELIIACIDTAWSSLIYWITLLVYISIYHD